MEAAQQQYFMAWSDKAVSCASVNSQEAFSVQETLRRRVPQNGKEKQTPTHHPQLSLNNKFSSTPRPTKI